MLGKVLDRNKVAVVVIGVGRGRVLYELNVVEICFAAVFAVAAGYLYLVGESVPSSGWRTVKALVINCQSRLYLSNLRPSIVLDVPFE